MRVSREVFEAVQILHICNACVRGPEAAPAAPVNRPPRPRVVRSVAKNAE